MTELYFNKQCKDCNEFIDNNGTCDPHLINYRLWHQECPELIYK